ncbi:MAG: replicative DNA helicase [Oscillospiraceae bacterium]
MSSIESMNGLRASEILGRELPYSLEAEQAVLGGILLDPTILPKVIEILKPESFYRPQHQQLFSIMMRMFTTAKTEDIITVIDEAVTMGIFETSAMAKTYLSGIMESVPSTANIESYCQIIKEKYQIRSLVNIANDIIETANEGSTDSQTMLDSAEQKIYDIRQGEVQGLERIDSVIIDTYTHLQELSGPEAELHLGSKTGFSQLDAITTGLNKSDLIILAARPAMGKSALALNIAVNSCKQTMKDVVIFSLEMGKEQLVSRMLASESLVNNTCLRTGKLEPEDWTKLASGTEQLQKLPIYLDDGAGINVPQMKAKLRRMKNLGLVIIDYLQLMSSPNKHTSRVTEVSEITRQLKLMAKELNVPVIALSQLSRSSEKREDKRPMLSDLRESGSIEQDADIILFLYRDAYYDKESTDQSVAECIVAKNRHGSTGTVKLAWIGEYTLFRSLDIRRE